MKLTFLIFLVSFFLPTEQAYSGLYKGHVGKVSDGDTVWFFPQSNSGWSADKSRLTIRMLGIDAPESHFPSPGQGMVSQSPWGDWSTEYLKSLVQSGKDSILQEFGKDHYGRTLGFVFRQKHDLNLVMVRAGWAIPYIICEGRNCNADFWKAQRVRDYLAACDEARAAKRGIFDPRHPMKEMPFEFRLRMSGRKPDKFVGDYSTRRLYQPKDYKSVDVCRRIFFMKQADAVKQGFH